MLLSDRRISALGKNMIEPFQDNKISKGVLSYGVSECGYDLRLSPNDFRIASVATNDMLDPKSATNSDYHRVTPYRGESDLYFIIPPLTYALGVTVERLNIPKNLTGLFIGKSTYARSMLLLNTTPVEPGFRGHITLEFFNCSRRPIKVYANEGICKLMLWDTHDMNNLYDGKYQNQAEQVVFSRI